MISITALNDNPPDSDEESNGPITTTKEALEEEAFEVYRKALEHIQYGRNLEAEEALKQLLLTDFTKQHMPRNDPKEVPLPPGLTLRYLAYKNIAVIASDRGDLKAAMEAYLEAVDIDMTDVSVWFKMGLIAQKLENFPLARLCFEEGLKCSPNHKLCLDRIITLTYALNDYSACLYYIARALEKYYSYTKGLAFRDQIYRDHPMLRMDSDVTFKECDPRVYTVKYDKEVAQKLINEALQIRERKRELCKPKPLPTVSFQKRFENYAWKSLGENLNSLYDYIKNSDPHISIACKVDLSKYWEGKCKENDGTEGEKESSPTTVTSSSEGSSSASPSYSAQTSQSQDGPLAKKDGLLLMEVDENNDDLVKNKDLPEIITGVAGNIQPRGKRKRFPYESIDPSWKRRSTRVRNPGVRKLQDNTNYMELLRKFLPSSLLGEGKEDEDDNDDPMALQIDIPLISDHTYGQSVPCMLEEKQQLPEDVEYLKNIETEEVKAFLEAHKANGGILDLYKCFLKELSLKYHIVWPPGLTDVYMSVYERWRNHITQPNLFSYDVPSERIEVNGWITLVYHELKVDKWQIKNRLASVSPSLNHARSGSSAGLGSDFPGNFFYEDADFLIHAMVRRDAFKEKTVEFIVRTLWQHSKLSILEGDMMGAVRFTDKAATVLNEEEEYTKQPIKIFLVNCHLYNVIYLASVDKKLESLQRSQSLEEVHRLYEQGEYQRVVDLLILTFTQPQTKAKTLEDGNIPERHYQLLLLQDSLWKLEVFKDCLYWGEAAFNEALQQYITSASNTTTRDWAHTIALLLLGLDKCLNKDESLLGKIGSGKLIRLSNNLIRVISLQMNCSEFNSETNIATLVTWMLMFRLIHHEEKKILSLASKSAPVKPKPEVVIVDNSDSSESSSSSSSDEDLASALPSSLMLLFTAHDYLGRRSWCTFSDGAFLQLTIDIMMKELQTSDKHSEDMRQGIEQCFYCLYGHPNKRTKVKHIMEHNASAITLTWERAIQLYEYFQPEVVPEFDSFKTSTVSAEIENLLRRILLLIPPKEDPTNFTESVVAYIEGGTNKYPTEPLTTAKPSIAVKGAYYLLGDYYFKNKEFGKASKFYILDIVVNPCRMDSWAGMALARSSQLEQKLTSSDLRNDTTVYRKSCSALRCFKRALELDPTRLALWIEYGNMAYILHAYASRQLKHQSQYNFPDDIIELLKNKREEMLGTAENCFLSANQRYQDCNEPAEVWLHHYMLGKISEKRQSSPEVFLEHYRLAAEHLHNEGAKYPKKILYHNPPELSIEALEVYYRTHTSILKFLLRKEIDQPTKEEFLVIQKYLKIADDSPFANFQELKEAESTPSSEEEEAVAQSSKKTTSKGQDHDYAHKHRKKSNIQPVESSSESSDSATIKDILSSLLSLVAERFDKVDNSKKTSTIVLGDQKLKKKVSDALTPVPSPKREIESINPEKDEGKKSDTLKDETIKKIKTEVLGNLDNFTFNDFIEKCLAAILECHQRFSQHYKSLYRLAHYYCYSQLNKNLQKSREIILGGTSHVPIPSLFGERKNANFFNGIWRVPIDEIDRPGSFATHMFRSIILLVDILRQQGDHNMLTQITIQLSRTPDLGKKYLRDTDRLHLAREAFKLCLGALRDEMNSLLLEEPPPEESRLIGCLMDIYRTWQTYQKNGVYPDEANDLLEEAYSMYKFGEVDPSPPVLEQAIRFCQSRSGYRQSSTQEGGQRATSSGNYNRSNSIANIYENDVGARSVSGQIPPLPLIVPPPYAILDGKGIPMRPSEPSIISQQVNTAVAQLPFSQPLFNSAGNEEFLKWYCGYLLSNAAKNVRRN